jgi:hypothetical protein
MIECGMIAAAAAAMRGVRAPTARKWSATWPTAQTAKRRRNIVDPTCKYGFNVPIAGAMPSLVTK